MHEDLVRTFRVRRWATNIQIREHLHKKQITLLYAVSKIDCVYYQYYRLQSEMEFQ